MRLVLITCIKANIDFKNIVSIIGITPLCDNEVRLSNSRKTPKNK